MKMHLRFLQSVIIGGMFLACTPNRLSYVVEGHIDGLTNPIMYAVTTSEFTSKIDTIIAKDGAFCYESSSDSITAIIFKAKTEEFSAWFTVWAQNGDHITVSGDVNHPELIEINGNEINELLTQFRQKHKTLFLSENELNFDENAKAYQNLPEEVCSFVEKHPQSIASLVLIQDFLIETQNHDRIEEALNRIEVPAKNDPLYEYLSEICMNMPAK